MKTKTTFNYIFKNVFFANPTLLDIFTYSTFYFCGTKTEILGFKKTLFYSKYIDLTLPLETIFSNFKSNTRGLIRKAEKLEIKFAIENDLKEFVNFYNSFAMTKNRRIINYKTLSQLKENLVITKSYLDENEPLTMHAYILNRQNKMCILYMSASLFRDSNKEMQKTIGIANRFLHYKDIEYFKTNFFAVYDLGGYAVNVEKGHEQFSINRFKDQFGGELINYSNYTSLVLYTSLKFKNNLSRILSKK